jgi:hypothetical protein
LAKDIPSRRVRSPHEEPVARIAPGHDPSTQFETRLLSTADLLAPTEPNLEPDFEPTHKPDFEPNLEPAAA